MTMEMEMEMEMTIDKQNGTCLYNDEKHIYWDSKTNNRYISVTTLIHNFYTPFDESFWSAYKSLEIMLGDKFSEIKSNLLKSKKFDSKLLNIYNIDEVEFQNKRQEFIDSWEKNKNEACDRGTKIHLEKELSYYDKPEYEIKHFNLGGKFKCERNHCELDYEKGVYPEYLVSLNLPDKNLLVAGQIDLLIKDGNDIYIADYKTNKKIDEKSYFDPKTKKFQMMRYPLSKLMDCNLMHYTMQLSTYAYLLQQINPAFEIKGLMLIHYDHEGNEKHYTLEYRKNEVEKMLDFYSKDQLIKEKKESRKPIEY